VHVRECVSVCISVCISVCESVRVTVSVNCYCSGDDLGPAPPCALTRPSVGLGVRS
jgi:hypothetical protein